jgi:haloacid dehalogenase-like hydrolase
MRNDRVREGFAKFVIFDGHQDRDNVLWSFIGERQGWMITGDNPMTAAAIAAQSGVDDFLAQATPEAKLKLIREEQAQGKLVAVCGDGTNDAPSLWDSDGGVQYPRVYIRALRQKIEPNPEQPRYILTEQGVGYRMRAPD